ncbi:hypothetical protein FCH83_09555 [Pseudomonas putida]|nr:hypothetical protein [Pseudomonas putida]NTZ00350.1 hypothetical protein [Pseudomonas putida]NTZ25000.1 hypothetical protein [Pseudomonas putida]NTZ55112.1 hypothetical protein [Pseudomonas putida]NTZ68656.1 hypothetical protein [Pseudomonas putida]
MAGHREPPGINDCPSLCQARHCGQRFRFYRADRQSRIRAKCTVQNARPCNLHGAASDNNQ